MTARAVRAEIARLPEGVEPWEIPLLEVAECDPVALPEHLTDCALIDLRVCSTPSPGTTGELF